MKITDTLTLYTTNDHRSGDGSPLDIFKWKPTAVLPVPERSFCFAVVWFSQTWISLHIRQVRYNKKTQFLENHFWQSSFSERYVYLTLGGFVLAIATMGPYSFLLFFSVCSSVLLIHVLDPVHIHPWAFGLQMCWQTFWHVHIQYQQYWLEETPDSR